MLVSRGDLVGGGRRPVHLLAQVLPVVDHQLLNSQKGLVPSSDKEGKNLNNKDSYL